MSEEINPRSLAVDILLAVNRDGEFSHIAVRSVLDKYRYLPHRDRAFIKRLSEGSIERRLELDYIIDSFSKTKVKKMKPVIRAILETGVYQLKYMDAVPDSAVCNEAVKLAKKRGFSGLSGFVNGVLRNLSRNLGNIAWPSMETEPVRALSVRYSMPEWIVEKWLAQFGVERCERILAAFLEKHKTCVRVDTGKAATGDVRASLEARGISVEPVKLSKHTGVGKMDETFPGVADVTEKCAIGKVEKGGDESPKQNQCFVRYVDEKIDQDNSPLKSVVGKEMESFSAVGAQNACDMIDDAFYIDNYDVLDEIPEFENGILYAQDVSSMMVARLAADGVSDAREYDFEKGGQLSNTGCNSHKTEYSSSESQLLGTKENESKVNKNLSSESEPNKTTECGHLVFALDVCAAPGGKSIHLAQLLRGRGHVEARDLTEYKADLIAENKERCGADNLSVKVWNATVFDAEMEHAADIVLADLPCSGLGVIGSKTDIKYKASPQKITELARLQRQILSVVKRYIKPGGILLYSTCTITEEENQQNLAWFLQENPGFSLEYERQFLPDEGCDGFYIAKLRSVC